MEHLTKKMLYDMENPPSDDYFGEQCHITLNQSVFSPFLSLPGSGTGRPDSCAVKVVTLVLMDLLSMLGLEVQSSIGIPL